MKNVFDKTVSDELIQRINKLNETSTRQWGTMTTAQMLAHCSISYEMTFEPDRFKKHNAFMRLLMKIIIKPFVVGEKPYKQNSHTSPEFIINNERELEEEKTKLIQFIEKVQQLGEKHFEGKNNHSFGKMTSKEWSNMYYKHLNHHLNQFGV